MKKRLWSMNPNEKSVTIYSTNSTVLKTTLKMTWNLYTTLPHENEPMDTHVLNMNSMGYYKQKKKRPTSVKMGCCPWHTSTCAESLREQVYPSSTWQVEEQPSPSRTFRSSPESKETQKKNTRYEFTTCVMYILTRYMWYINNSAN